LTGRDLDILRKNCDLNSSKKWINLKEREDILIMLPLEERLDQVMNFAYKQKFFCSNDIARFLNVSQSSAVHYLRKLVKLEKLIIEGYGPNTTYKLSPGDG